MQHILALPAIGPSHILTAFKDVGKPVPVDLRGTIRNMKNQKAWLNFTDWEAKVTPDGQPTEVHPRKAGTFAWNEAVIHTVQNAGKTEGHILRIELKF